MKLNAMQSNVLAHLFAGKTVRVGFETAAALVAAERISSMPSHGDMVELTPDMLTLQGRISGEDRWAFLNRAALKKAARAKVRAEAMWSVGMVRTKGGWE